MKRSEIRVEWPSLTHFPDFADAPSGATFLGVVRYRRNFVAGGTYFFTVTLEDRRSRDLIDHVAALRAAFRRTRRERPFAIDAIVVLPDHLHTIMTLPKGDADFSGRWRRIKSVFSRKVAKLRGMEPNRKGEYAVWQRRFWEHTIRDDEDFSQHFDYIHFNPVRHHLTSRVRDWKYSSFHRYVRLEWMPRDWGGDMRESRQQFGER
jgi:putative transposase